MTTFTDKEMIKEIKERIGSLDVRDNIERRAYEIALASLEAEPVAWLHSDNGLGIPAITRSKNVADSWLSKGWYVQPLYIAKPVPVVPDARPSLNNGIVGFDEGWNACRATMLHGAKPVSQTYKLNELSGNSPVIPDGWISCSDRMPDDGRIQFSVSLPAACGGDKYFIDGVFQPLRYERDCEKAVVAAGGVVNWVK